MLKVLMKLTGIGKRPAANTPELKPELKEESGLPKELTDEIKRWRYIQGYANSLRAHMGER
ncbi:MAG: hypothetical protein A3I68_03700 [Candidatus Melainabacteria bacterium RIFCSPLOWO2_02_FULL_35_15]|nr:MAG: hypothetical protein A3F80_04015 [Candidatus Melainabacteria bacterium RIFCSPLOWO2_12_FULL_35_11]OGI14703.1 MAG: hypothetical protein A3I68_03700 [Candidatus Melainabacteria bacterium RIFCSPLOWO2_02_FULL_35_15]